MLTSILLYKTFLLTSNLFPFQHIMIEEQTSHIFIVEDFKEILECDISVKCRPARGGYWSEETAITLIINVEDTGH